MKLKSVEKREGASPKKSRGGAFDSVDEAIKRRAIFFQGNSDSSDSSDSEEDGFAASASLPGVPRLVFANPSAARGVSPVGVTAAKYPVSPLGAESMAFAKQMHESVFTLAKEYLQAKGSFESNEKNVVAKKVLDRSLLASSTNCLHLLQRLVEMARKDLIDLHTTHR